MKYNVVIFPTELSEKAAAYNLDTNLFERHQIDDAYKAVHDIIFPNILFSKVDGTKRSVLLMTERWRDANDHFLWNVQMLCSHCGMDMLDLKVENIAKTDLGQLQEAICFQCNLKTLIVVSDEQSEAEELFFKKLTTILDDYVVVAEKDILDMLGKTQVVRQESAEKMNQFEKSMDFARQTGSKALFAELATAIQETLKSPADVTVEQ